MLILKRMQQRLPSVLPATISFHTAKLSSTGLLRLLDSMPSILSCRLLSLLRQPPTGWLHAWCQLHPC